MADIIQPFSTNRQFSMKLVDRVGYHAYEIIAQPPANMLTGGTPGVNPRLRTEDGDHAFFGKLQFRTFYRINIAAGTEIIIKVVVGVNLILRAVRFTIVNGQIDVETKVGGTEGGSFSTPLPVFNRNNMTEGPSAPASQTTLDTGGTHTGGTVLDVLVGKAGSGAAVNVQTIGVTQGDERGILPGTYYYRVQAITGGGNVEGVLNAWWEERP